MKYRERTELLKAAGWEFERNGKGSHKVWRKGNLIIPVPDHGSKEINPGVGEGDKKTSRNQVKKGGLPPLP